MKLKLGLFSLLLVCAVLLFSCDILLGNDNNGNCAHTWVWKTETPATEEKDGLRTQYCSKCTAKGSTQTIPSGTVDMEESDYIEISDDELEIILSSTEPNPDAVVGPLITTKWTQSSPYNDLFPMVDGKRSVTDCGNIAMAQILRFHRNPAKGNGQSTSVRINSNTFTVPALNFNIAYDWDNILDSYTTANPGNAQQRNAAATMVYHFAAAVGASMDAGAGAYPRNYMAALTNILGYDKSIQLHYRNYYKDSEWAAMIRQQLDLGLPVYYWGKREGHSHAFVIDGYDSNGRFHINWGWGGKDNGWYAINNLNPPSKGHYKYDNLILVNIKPDKGGVPAGYEMALRNFSVNKTSAAQNELFTVTMQIRNLSTSGAFSGGQMGVALVNNSGGIIDVIANINRAALNPLSTSGTATINCYVPGTINPGEYQLMAVIRETGEEWKTITLSYREEKIPDAIPITITEGVRSPFLDFYYSVAAYSKATTNIEVIVNENLTIDQLVSIPAPSTAGVKLTIRSANTSQPVTLTRGLSGNLFTITNGATLIFRDIIIDGGRSSAFADNGGGTLVRVNSGGAFIMESGAVLRNNANSSYGSGVYVNGTGTFNMTGGEICGNKADYGGGVYSSSNGSFTMTSGKISGNTASNGGGVYVNTSTFTMTGGEISGNTASTANGVRIYGDSAVFNLNGGVVAGTGSGLSNIVSGSGTYNLNTGTDGASNNAVVIAWNSTSTNLTVSTGGTAVWEDQSGVLGISYVNGANAGWIKAW